ncbi:hypothetical protein [Paenibacillus glycanilyticus]|uniref:Uncharacterized protein n=1 Tax=Paenibacillus glycanilyticus TaxID=126569 RepID=A0ABQ6G7F0_9BACL|nr:hypothetical protein [Paenibacillus glycanilyticus]GLX66914.1 hypothetical protein MU1_12580 [Paenibacillus glycanilyticus]
MEGKYNKGRDNSMKRNWKLAGAALLVAIAVPVSAYAADNNLNSQSQDEKKASFADGQTTKPAGKPGETVKNVKQEGNDWNLVVAKKESSAAAQGKEDKQIREEGIRIDFQQIAATKLGLDKEAFQKALEAGKSLADIAEGQGKEVQPLIDELTKEISDEIQSKSTKSLSDEEKANVRKKAAMEADRVFKTPLNKEQEVKDQGIGEYNMQAAFELLGIDKATFAEQIQAGKSFVDIAKDHGVSRQKLIDALMSDFTAKIASIQATGDITQDQANQKKQAVLKDIEDFVDHTQTMFVVKEEK